MLRKVRKGLSMCFWPGEGYPYMVGLKGDLEEGKQRAGTPLPGTRTALQHGTNSPLFAIKLEEKSVWQSAEQPGDYDTFT